MRKGKEVRNGNEHEKERENEKKALFLTGVPRAADEAGRLGAGLEQPRQSVPDLVHDGEEGGVHVAEERERCWWLKKKRLVEVEEVEVEIALLMPPLQDRRVLSLPLGPITFLHLCLHRSLFHYPLLSPCAASTRGCAFEGPGPIKMRLGTAMGAEASVPSSRPAVAGVVSPLRAPRDDEAMMMSVICAGALPSFLADSNSTWKAAREKRRGGQKKESVGGAGSFSSKLVVAVFFFLRRRKSRKLFLLSCARSTAASRSRFISVSTVRCTSPLFSETVRQSQSRLEAKKRASTCRAASPRSRPATSTSGRWTLTATSSASGGLSSRRELPGRRTG